MSKRNSANKSKKLHRVLSWQEKMEAANAEQEAVSKEVEELASWITMIEAMDDMQRKEYIMNLPHEGSKSTKEGENAPVKKARRISKPRSASSSSQGIMDIVWKFHTENDEDQVPAAPLQV